MKEVYIKALSYYLPEKVLTNEDLVRDFPEWSAEKVVSKVGINKRHISADDETSGDMAVSAARNLFSEWNINPSDIDFVILCTQSPDYFLPTTACIIQERLNIPTTAGALDFNLGCSGYVYGLAVAKGLIAGGIAKNVLLLTAEQYTKFIHPKDKGNRTIFGDGASASIISDNGFAKIRNFSLGTDGKGMHNLIVETGGLRNRNQMPEEMMDDNNAVKYPNNLYMNGSDIFTFTLERVPPLINDILAKNDLDKSDIGLHICHQANKYMLDFLRKKMAIESDKFYYYLSEVGNTVSSTIPIAIYEARKENRLEGKVLIAGFGVGYSWGGTILEIIN